MTNRIEVVTLDICTCILPVLSGLLESDLDRSLSHTHAVFFPHFNKNFMVCVFGRLILQLLYDLDFGFFLHTFHFWNNRYLDISMEMLVKLVRTFGSVIYSTLSATSSVGVNIEAEQRCFLPISFNLSSLSLSTRLSLHSFF